MPIKYLTEVDRREHLILKKFDCFLNNFSKFLVSLDISPGYSWYLIEIQMDRLVPSIINVNFVMPEFHELDLLKI